MLTAAGVELSLVQLLGRWTSSAIQRYTQDSALVRVPQIPQQILTPAQQPGTIQLTMAASASRPEPAVVEGPVTKAARPKATASSERGLRAELEKLREAIARPGENFCFPAAGPDLAQGLHGGGPQHPVVLAHDMRLGIRA